MKYYIGEIKKISKEMELQELIEFEPSLLLPEERIRDYCYENLCGHYEKHYMCPPFIGTVSEIKTKLSKYNKAILFRYSKKINVSEDRKSVEKTKRDFHIKILKLEKMLSRKNIESWGLIGGNCSLCKECKAIENIPCKYPRKARPSLESLGIDVQKLLDNFGLDNKFYYDRITWTGCILINENLKDRLK
ncbi:MAG: hypothetical protein APG12_01673 [Candidatus Methanofastidiosum methylothiophilum]|uniref:Metal-binding protein n=1 Tax=Candidatus Methanofastidiosum methylothiophilum TaxID=1705564 RepID=A0A150IHW3_9EURY|nr:MAG: hypothetical protein APG10_01645 [Candidatus Methanofastidiosum methylthiophilus]KYC46624.1 MAG: hypothetical protein APG11_01773 [Candidatus Methanofastidiosum methylthiophilus]KYC49112.1 MAG: hypothetical protein APG12_01673 [Candidatus Methanofastidiosum methylthiophilus]